MVKYVESCKKTRAGTLLVKTKNTTQANKLLKLTSMHNKISVSVSLHKTLNVSKGVIYCNDLRGINEADILEELKTQNISEVKKILKKQNNELIETGLIIITFDSQKLPEHMHFHSLTYVMQQLSTLRSHQQVLSRQKAMQKLFASLLFRSGIKPSLQCSTNLRKLP